MMLVGRVTTARMLGTPRFTMPVAVGDCGSDSDDDAGFLDLLDLDADAAGGDDLVSVDGSALAAEEDCARARWVYDPAVGFTEAAGAGAGAGAADDSGADTPRAAAADDDDGEESEGCGGRGAPVLALTLVLVDLAARTRPLYACVRDGCGCDGIFYTCFQRASRVRVTLALVRGGGGGVDARAAAAFAATRPVVRILHVGGAVEVVDCAGAVHVDGAWRVDVQPAVIGAGAVIDARVGLRHAVRSRPFEVATKPSNWLLVEGGPAGEVAGALRAAGASRVIAQPGRDVTFAEYRTRCDAAAAGAEVEARVRGALPSLILALGRAAAADASLRCVLVRPPAARCGAAVQAAVAPRGGGGGGASASACVRGRRVDAEGEARPRKRARVAAAPPFEAAEVMLPLDVVGCAAAARKFCFV